MRKRFKKGLAAFLAMAMVVALVEPMAGGGFLAQAADETVNAATNVIANDDGTFEGNDGNISLMSAHQIAGAEGNGWSSNVEFERVESSEGTAIAVTSTPVIEGNTYDYLYIKVNTPVQTGRKYSVTMDVTALDDNYTNGLWGYWVLSPEAVATSEKCIQFFQEMSVADLFKTDATFSFTSNGDYDYFYILLREAESKTDINFNFTVDNIEFAGLGYAVTNSVLNDDGTFEGNDGSVSLYSSTEFDQSKLNTNIVYANANGNYKLSFQKVEEENNTYVHVTSNNTTRWETLYIKFDEINSRNDAELYRNLTLKVEKSLLESFTGEDEFLVDDLIGAILYDTKGNMVGQIMEILNYGASDIFVVEKEGRSYSIPYVAEIFKVENGLLVVDADKLQEVMV